METLRLFEFQGKDLGIFLVRELSCLDLVDLVAFLVFYRRNEGFISFLFELHLQLFCLCNALERPDLHGKQPRLFAIPGISGVVSVPPVAIKITSGVT